MMILKYKCLRDDEIRHDKDLMRVTLKKNTFSVEYLPGGLGLSPLNYFIR